MKLLTDQRGRVGHASRLDRRKGRTSRVCACSLTVPIRRPPRLQQRWLLKYPLAQALWAAGEGGHHSARRQPQVSLFEVRAQDTKRRRQRGQPFSGEDLAKDLLDRVLPDGLGPGYDFLTRRRQCEQG